VLPALERRHDVLALTLAGHAGGPPIQALQTTAPHAEAILASPEGRRLATRDIARTSSTSRPSCWPTRCAALLDAIAKSLAGDAGAAERAVRDAGAMVSGSGDWYRAMVNVDLAHTIIARDGSLTPLRPWLGSTPCPRRAIASGWSSGTPRVRGSPRRQAITRVPSRRGARRWATAEATGLMLVRGDAHRMLAEVLRTAGRTEEAAAAAGRALALQERKANVAAAARTRRLLASLGA
jgi:hypothetical protein